MQESSLKSDSGILIVLTPEEVSVLLLESSNTKITGIKKYFKTLFTYL